MKDPHTKELVEKFFFLNSWFFFIKVIILKKFKDFLSFMVFSLRKLAYIGHMWDIKSLYLKSLKKDINILEKRNFIL